MQSSFIFQFLWIPCRMVLDCNSLCYYTTHLFSEFTIVFYSHNRNSFRNHSGFTNVTLIKNIVAVVLSQSKDLSLQKNPFLSIQNCLLHCCYLCKTAISCLGERFIELHKVYHLPSFCFMIIVSLKQFMSFRNASIPEAKLVECVCLLSVMVKLTPHQVS